MSVEVMTQVFKRYPEGGNERLLALAIADHARSDGTHVYPSVALLAEMTRQSERSVQRLLHHMLSIGWLHLVRKSSGRRGDTNEYRICPQWLQGGSMMPPAEVPDRRTLPKLTGANLSPVSPVDKLSTTGDTQGLSGDIAVSPNPSLPINTQYPLTPVGTGDCGKPTKPKQPESPPGRRAKPPWRWRASFEGYVQRGEQLGLRYSQAALGTAWTDDALRAHQQAYRRLIDAEHERAGGDP